MEPSNIAETTKFGAKQTVKVLADKKLGKKTSISFGNEYEVVNKEDLVEHDNEGSSRDGFFILPVPNRANTSSETGYVRVTRSGSDEDEVDECSSSSDNENDEKGNDPARVNKGEKRQQVSTVDTKTTKHAKKESRPTQAETKPERAIAMKNLIRSLKEKFDVSYIKVGKAETKALNVTTKGPNPEKKGPKPEKAVTTEKENNAITMIALSAVEIQIEKQELIEWKKAGIEYVQFFADVSINDQKQKGGKKELNTLIEALFPRTDQVNV